MLFLRDASSPEKKKKKKKKKKKNYEWFDTTTTTMTGQTSRNVVVVFKEALVSKNESYISTKCEDFFTSNSRQFFPHNFPIINKRALHICTHLRCFRKEESTMAAAAEEEDTPKRRARLSARQPPGTIHGKPSSRRFSSRLATSRSASSLLHSRLKTVTPKEEKSISGRRRATDDDDDDDDVTPRVVAPRYAVLFLLAGILIEHMAYIWT